MDKTTDKVYMEVKDGFVVVRCMEKNFVVDSLVKTKKAMAQVMNVFASCDNDTFSQVWDKLNAIKGLNPEYRAY